MSELSLCGKHPRDVLTPHHFSTAAAAGVEPASCPPTAAGDPRPGSAVPWHPSWADSLTWDRSQQRSLRLSFVLLFSRTGLERWPVPGCHPRPLALLILGTVLAAHAPHPRLCALCGWILPGLGVPRRLCSLQGWLGFARLSRGLQTPPPPTPAEQAGTPPPKSSQ